MIRRYAIIIGCGIFAACTFNGPPAPIESKSPAQVPPKVTSAQPRAVRAGPRPSSYTVRRGDTLHAIAWRFGLDYRDLVKWNRLANPNLIVVGQRLSLRRPKQTANKNTATAKTSNKRSAPPAPAPKKTSGGGPKKWIWPSDGRHELATSVSGSKGLNIFGDRGQPVRAAAPGKVVYSGSGLRGYGQLIIVQHDDAFLSAYAHNQRRLVEEGMQVKRKDVIAHMGDSDAKNVMLHFEIRRNGKPVDPLRFLPSR